MFENKKYVNFSKNVLLFGTKNVILKVKLKFVCRR